MKIRTIEHWVIVGLTLFSFIVSYWITLLVDDQVMRGTTADIQVTSLSAPEAGQDVVEALSAYANDYGENIGVYVGSGHERDLYVAGPAAESWINDGYGGIPGTPHVTAHPLVDLGADQARATYDLTGDSEFTHGLLAMLQSRGVTAHEMINQSFSYLFSGTTLSRFIEIFLVAGAAMMGFLVVVRSREIAIYRQHGYSALGIMVADIRSIPRGIVGGLVVACACVFGGLAVASGTSATMVILRYFLLAFLLVALVMIAVKWATIVTLGLVSQPLALKGRLPGRTILGLLYVVRILSICMLLELVISGVNQVGELGYQAAESDQWQKASGYSVAVMNGARDQETIRDSAAVFAGVTRKLSTQGEVVFAQLQPAGIGTLSGQPYPVMIYNETVARVSLGGSAVGELGRGPLQESLLLVPESRWNEGFDYQGYFDDYSVEEVEKIPDGSRTFTWAIDETSVQERAEEIDPLVIIVPNDLPLSDNRIVNSASQNQVMFAGDSLDRSIGQDAELGNFIMAIRPVTEVKDNAYRAARSEATTNVIGGVLATLLALAIGVTVAALGRAVYARKIWVNHVHGRSIWRSVWPVLTLEALVIAFTGWFLWDIGAQAREWSHTGAGSPALIASQQVTVLGFCTGLGVVGLTTLVALCLLVFQAWRANYPGTRGILRSGHL